MSNNGPIDSVKKVGTDKTNFSFTFDDIAKGLEEKKKALEERTKTTLTNTISGIQNSAVYTGGPISFKSGNTDSGAFHG